MKQFIVIETFRPGGKARVYERFRAQGRMLPAGLKMLKGVSWGWPRVLSSLKSFLETEKGSTSLLAAEHQSAFE